MTQRIIGEYGSTQADTLIIAMAGIHGNEPGGIVALEQVFTYLQHTKPVMNGYLLGMKGNLTALQKKQRFVNQDFNRIWSEENISLARNHDSFSTCEMQELRETLFTLSQLNFSQYSKKIFIDLHTTSGKNGAFIITGHAQKEIRWLEYLKVPVILGLEERLESPAIRYMQNQGFISFAFEGGFHTDPVSVENLLWAVWGTLTQSNTIETSVLPDLSNTTQRLHAFCEELPLVFKLEYLHKVRLQDDFIMKPGFQNFDKINKGELLAKDRQGNIYASCDGYLLMPLYQKTGDDGFFVIREYPE